MLNSGEVVRLGDRTGSRMKRKATAWRSITLTEEGKQVGQKVVSYQVVEENIFLDTRRTNFTTASFGREVHGRLK